MIISKIYWPYNGEISRSGVYDSPMAQDYYVRWGCKHTISIMVTIMMITIPLLTRRFGFMFGGGRSGMYGLQALQQVEDPMHAFHSRWSLPSCGNASSPNVIITRIWMKHIMPYAHDALCTWGLRICLNSRKIVMLAKNMAKRGFDLFNTNSIVNIVNISYLSGTTRSTTIISTARQRYNTICTTITINRRTTANSIFLSSAGEGDGRVEPDCDEEVNGSTAKAVPKIHGGAIERLLKIFDVSR